MENNGIKDRLNIEKRLATLEASVNEMKTNHLPHLQLKMDKLYKKMDRIQWLLVITLIGIIAGLIQKYV